MPAGAGRGAPVLGSLAPPLRTKTSRCSAYWCVGGRM